MGDGHLLSSRSQGCHPEGGYGSAAQVAMKDRSTAPDGPEGQSLEPKQIILKP